MLSPSKNFRFSGFSSAASVLAGADPSNIVSQEEEETSPSAECSGKRSSNDNDHDAVDNSKMIMVSSKKKPRLSLVGFCSAASVLEDPSIVLSQQQAPPECCPRDMKRSASAVAVPEQASEVDGTVLLEFRITLTCVGWSHQSHLHQDIKPSTGMTVLLEREPTNEHDENAVCVSIIGTTSSGAAENKDDDGTNSSSSNNNNKSSSISSDAATNAETKKKIGYIKKQEATLLAPLMDRNMIVAFSNVSISAVYRASFLLRVAGSVDSDETLELVQDNFRRVAADLDTTNTSKKITTRDVEQASSAPYSLSDLEPMPWSPAPTASNKGTGALWSPTHPYNVSKKAPLSKQDFDNCAKQSRWPPSDEILARLGLAPSQDATWWLETAGLLPPAQWNVTGALDVTAKLPSLSLTHKKFAANTLDGAIHGVTNVWHPDTLEAANDLMREPNFWCRRSSDAMIKAFGVGGYVLGQQQEKLVLVRGAPHTVLTEKMCLAHNLVYTATMLTPPAAPGFNTLIFGYNHSGAGFHYHQDAVSELKAKNGSLVPRQPVVTTVVYQKPGDDSGKEVVLWKPLLNFSSAGFELYDAARAVCTTHGMMHVQQAGLQSKAVHGVFHAPKDNHSRKGYRVAITARISKPNANEIIQEYSSKGSYCEEYGPGGDCSLTRSVG